uniref:L1 transposable element RRM domain-containing protein n=1 Tax=Gouania willdenowi TaxID=441366 RepID=A0A8C5DJ07_GOUWI
MPPKPRNVNSSGGAVSRPAATASSSAPSDPASAPMPPLPDVSGPSLNIATTDFKADLLASLREEMVGVFKTELATAMTDTLAQIKSELQAVTTELSGSISAIRAEVGELKGTVHTMEGSLTVCSDDVTSLQTKVESLSTQVLALESNCEDLEARSRRNNIRIVGLHEEDGPVTAAMISTLLMEAFDLEKPPLVDRAHRSLQPRPKPGERPRPVIAWMHYCGDCIDILQRARAKQRIKIKNAVVSIFPDFTAKTARARAAFNDIRRQLREIPDVRFGILHPARLRITRGNVTREFTSPGEANVFLKTLK